jgi:hypothetical protein
MMQRLFWRIFVAIWIATVVLLVAFAWIATMNFEREKIPGLDITRLQASMDDLLSRTSRELRHDGEDATRQWLQAAADFGPARVYVFKPDGSELLGRTVSQSVRDAATEVLNDPGDANTAAGPRTATSACARVHCARATAAPTRPWPRSKAISSRACCRGGQAGSGRTSARRWR